MVLVEGIGGGTHLKLADMGACLPYSASARDLVSRSRDIIKNLRDGDWRAQAGVIVAAADAGLSSTSSLIETTGTAAQTSTQETTTGDDNEEDSEQEEDWRVEGTSEYLSPEVLSGASMPTVSSDAFAFGVTLFQVLAGRLPDTDAIWGLENAAFSAKGSHRVHFTEGAATPSSKGGISGFPPGFPPIAADLVRGLLHPDPAQRLGGGERGLGEVADHPWFAPLLGSGELVRGTDSVGDALVGLSSLHRRVSPALLRGLAAPSSDPTWSRRHYSSMWAPMPRAYTTYLASSAGVPVAGGSEPETLAGLTGTDRLGALAHPEAEGLHKQTLSSCIFADVLQPLPLPVAPLATASV